MNKVWFPLYVGDYLGDTMHLTTQQHGAYLLLMMAYWRNGGPLDDNETELSSIAKVMANEWQMVWQTVGKFFGKHDGKIHHKRIDEEIEKAKRVQKQRSDAGKAGANGKWHGKTMANAITGYMANARQAPVQSQSHSTDREREGQAAPPAVPKTRTPTLKDVLAFAEMHAVKKEHAESFFNHYEAQGWINGAGLAITGWTNKLIEWSSRNNQLTPVRANSAPANGKAKSVFELKTVMEAKIAMAAEIKNKHCAEHGLGDTWSDQTKRAEYRKLKTEIRDLQKQIGAAA